MLPRGITENQIVEVKTIRGEARIKAKITTDIKQGVCFMPMHFGKIQEKTFGRTNNLTNTLVDPRSKEPDFKYSAVQVLPYQKPVEKIVIIGAGSAGLGFIKAYRELNQQDEIHVFSKEIYPFIIESCFLIISQEHKIGNSWSSFVKTNLRRQISTYIKA
jgi:ferredoxin-nitrate reductase